jgi:hypothetical protein
VAVFPSTRQSPQNFKIRTKVRHKVGIAIDTPFSGWISEFKVPSCLGAEGTRHLLNRLRHVGWRGVGHCCENKQDFIGGILAVDSGATKIFMSGTI